uniref:Putative secreted mucin n=1 Tax=Corethrella appendiculata TaxID=1370023 RepID=U5EPF6_9DIPT
MFKIVLFLSFVGVNFAGVYREQIANFVPEKQILKHEYSHNLHYSTHEASVQTARKGAAERLQQQGVYSGQLQSGSSLGSARCFDCIDRDVEAVGHGVVGYTGNDHDQQQSSSKYQASSASSSRYEQRQSGNAYPIYPSGGSKSSYYSANQRESLSSSLQAQPVYSVPVEGSSRYSSSSSSRHDNSQRTQQFPVTIYPASSSASNAASSRSEYLSQNAYQDEDLDDRQTSIPVYTPLDRYSSSSSSHRGGQHIEDRQQTVPVFSSNTYNDNLDQQQSVSGVPVYADKYVSSHSQNTAESQRQQSSSSSVIPVYTPQDRYSTFSSSNRADTHQEKTYVPVYKPIEDNRQVGQTSRVTSTYVPVYVTRANPYYQPSSSRVYSTRYGGSDSLQQRTTADGASYTSVQYPAGSSSSTHQQSSSSNREELSSQTGGVYVPINTGSTSVASKYSEHEKNEQRSGTSYVVPVAPISTSSSSRYGSRHEEHSRTGTNYGQSGVYTPIIGGASTGSSQHSSSSSASDAYSKHRLSYPITGDQLGQQFGSGLGLSGDKNDLSEFMSESERLARAQSQSVQSGTVSGSSVVQNRYSANDNSDVALNTVLSNSNTGAGAGGYQRTKSWASSSKWASGQKYDDEGKIKSYGYLSTAESENHNIDGKTTGYKAATTTLEDDGKVSTYSIHTP